MKRKLNNKTLDLIGRQLIESERPRSNDIESIISNPRLISMVKARIAADAYAPGSVIHKNNRAILSFTRRYSVAIVGATVVLITIIVGAAGFLRPGNSQFASTKIQIPEIIPDAARPDPPDMPVVGKLSAGRATYHETRDVRVEKIVARANVRITDGKMSPSPAQEPQGEFFPISAGYDADETGERIVRVDVPKSSLFALGVNIPLENGPEAVKADLLIGADGMTRAIRVVK